MRVRECFLLGVVNTKTGYSCSAIFSKRITRDKALKVLSKKNFWGIDEEALFLPMIPVLEKMSNKDFEVRGIFTSKTFFFKEIERSLTVEKSVIWL